MVYASSQECKLKGYPSQSSKQTTNKQEETICDLEEKRLGSKSSPLQDRVNTKRIYYLCATRAQQERPLPHSSSDKVQSLDLQGAQPSH